MGTYLFQGADPDVPYYFRVRGIDGVDYTAYSNVTRTRIYDSPFIFEITTTSSYTTFQLPLEYYSHDEVYDFSIDWGDGYMDIVSGYTDSRSSHIYTDPGVYEVRISGICQKFNAAAALGESIRPLLTKIISWGNINCFYYCFHSCVNLTEIPVDTYDAWKEVGWLGVVFFNCTSLTSIPSGLFDTIYKDIPTIDNMFYNCISLTSIPSGLFDKLTTTTNFSNVFYNCVSLTSIPDGLFDECVSATNFNQTFFGCGITTIPDNLFINNINTTDFSRTFNYCLSLISVGNNVFSGLSLTTTFEDTFGNCSSLTTIGTGIFDGCNSASNFRGLFYQCNLTNIPTGLFNSCVNATSFRSCFQENYGLTSIPTGLFSNCTGVTNFISTFQSCVNLTGNADTLWLTYTGGTDGTECFINCTGLTNYNYIPIDWGGPAYSTILYGETISETEVNLSWAIDIRYNWDIEVYRSSGDTSNFMLIDTLPSGTSEFYDSGLTIGTPYYYKIRTTSGSTYSDYSNTISIMTIGSAYISSIQHSDNVQNYTINLSVAMVNYAVSDSFVIYVTTTSLSNYTGSTHYVAVNNSYTWTWGVVFSTLGVKNVNVKLYTSGGTFVDEKNHTFEIVPLPELWQYVWFVPTSFSPASQTTQWVWCNIAGNGYCNDPYGRNPDWNDMELVVNKVGSGLPALVSQSSSNISNFFYENGEWRTYGYTGTWTFEYYLLYQGHQLSYNLYSITTTST